MKLERQGDIGIFYIDTESNNALNFDSIREANTIMDEAEQDESIRALVVTAAHKSIFSPGVDLRTMILGDRADMRLFFEALTALVRRKFNYPKPEVYALNGHTVAAGFMMAAAGEYRIMVEGRAKIGLMEIEIGLAAPIGVVEMLNYLFDGRTAGTILLGGRLFTPDEALRMGLVDELATPEDLLQRAVEKAQELGSKPSQGYRRLKRYLRQRVAEQMQSLDEQHYDDLVDQWFSAETQEHLHAAVERMTQGAKATPKPAGG